MPKPETGPWWVVLRLHRWDSYGLEGCEALKLSVDGESIGCLEVFSTKEAAEAVALGASVRKIEEVPDEA